MLTPARDCEPANWIAQSLHGFAQDVGSIVPPVFPVFLRVFHPASMAGRPIPWGEVARANGRTAHPEMQFHALLPMPSDIAPDAYDARSASAVNPPRAGSLDEDIIIRLLPVLREHTQTPERCWFAFWNGWGTPVPLASPPGLLTRLFKGAPRRKRSETHHPRRSAPGFSIPGRELLLFEGTIDDAHESYYQPYGLNHFQSAYYWWPDDRKWCVASEIDLMSTYIGTEEDCAAAILQTSGIEAMHADVGDLITAAGDTVNPNPLAN
jgi:hypothetical protein